MPASKVKVVPAYDPRGSLIWSAILGGASGLLYVGLTKLAGYAAFFGITWLCVLLPPLWLFWWLLPIWITLPFGLRFVGRCQRLKQTYLVGQAFGTGFVLAPLGIALLRSNTPLSSTRDMLWLLALPLFALLIGAIFGLLNLSLRWLMRSLRFVVLEQDGTLCWRCGYAARRVDGATRCQECGKALNAEAPQPLGLARLAKRHARIVLALILAVVLGLALHRCITVSLPTQRLFDRISTQGAVFRGHMLNTAASGTSWNPAYGWEATGLCVPLPGESIMHLLVMQEQNPVLGQPAIQLQLAPATAGAFGSLLPGYANPFVVCDLTAAQTEHVRQHGLPQSLIDAMKQTAQRAGWVPLNPPIGPTQVIQVPTDGHFPPSSSP